MRKMPLQLELRGCAEKRHKVMGKQQAAAVTSEKGRDMEARSRCLSCGASPFRQMGRSEGGNAGPALEDRIHGVTRGILAR